MASPCAFRKGKHCSKSICVTNGCLPQNTDGVDIFFQGGGSIQGAGWLKNGKSAGSIRTSASDDVYWYGHTPPASPFARRAHSAHPAVARAAIAQPKVVLLGRTASKSPQTTTSVAPAGAYGVNFKWFLAPSSAQKQCIVAGGAAWTNPPMEFEYTSHGVLNSRVSVLKCALAATGAPVFFNGINFSFRPGGTSYNAVSAVPTFNGASVDGNPARTDPAAACRYGRHRLCVSPRQLRRHIVASRIRRCCLRRGIPGWQPGSGRTPAVKPPRFAGADRGRVGKSSTIVAGCAPPGISSC